MHSKERQEHWEKIYQTKSLTEVSWYQPKPETSLHYIQSLKLSKDSKIIDIGGGDSFLVDFLIEAGFTDISVLDISPSAIDRAKKRLGEKAEKIKWIVSDIVNFEPKESYDLWHDRAAFHFLKNETDIHNYLKIASNAVKKDGDLIIGTFSIDGPLKCSGIEIQQYSAESLKNCFSESFSAIQCEYIDHQTPFNTIQNFVFCVFKKI